MANELHYQSLVVKAVKLDGGFAFKSSNRFLAGVADLYVKLPNHPAAYWEVKLDAWPKKATTIKLDLTPLQKKFLHDNQAAGGSSGVIGFAKNEHRLMMTTLTLDAAEGINYLCPIDCYHELKVGDREIAIIELLLNPLRYVNV